MEKSDGTKGLESQQVEDLMWEEVRIYASLYSPGVIDWAAEQPSVKEAQYRQQK